MDLEANIDINANVDLNVDVDANVDVNVELNANADVELEIDAPEMNVDVEAELNVPEVNAEVEGEFTLPRVLAPEITLPETKIEVNVGVNAGQQDIEVGGEVNTQNNTKKQESEEKVSQFKKLGTKEGLGQSALDGLLDEGIKADKVRTFILACNSLQILQALINIGVTIFFATLSELYLSDYMDRWGNNTILGIIRYWFRSQQSLLKLCLFISIMFSFTRCARQTKCGGLALFISNTFWSVMINMCYTVFPSERSCLFVLSFYCQFLATLVGIRHYIGYEKFEYDSKKAAISAGFPLMIVSILISMVDSEYSSDLILPNILFFFWGVSASFTNFLCLEGTKKYVEMKNTCFGSQIVYVDIGINMYEAMLRAFSNKDDEVKDITAVMEESLGTEVECY